MKKFVLRAALAVLAVTAAAPAMAEDRLTLTLTPAVVSEYYFRGISQSDGHPAVQLGGEGAFQINETVAGYLGFWGSSVDFNDSTAAELDLVGGFRFTFDKLSLDAGLIRYTYLDAPAGNNYDFTEGKLTAAYDFGFVIPSAGVYYSPNYYNDSGKSFYYTAGVTVPLPVTEFDPKIVANIGQQSIDKPQSFFGAGNTDDKYLDWNIGLFASYWGFTAGVQYVDSDLKKTHCANGSNCGPAAVVSLSYGFEF